MTQWKKTDPQQYHLLNSERMKTGADNSKLALADGHSSKSNANVCRALPENV